MIETDKKKKQPVAVTASGSRRKRHWYFAPAAALFDTALWLLLFLSLSKLTGSYNLITHSSLVVPVVVTMQAISLVGAYRHRTDFACLG